MAQGETAHRGEALHVGKVSQGAPQSFATGWKMSRGVTSISHTGFVKP